MFIILKLHHGNLLHMGIQNRLFVNISKLSYLRVCRKKPNDSINLRTRASCLPNETIGNCNQNQLNGMTWRVYDISACMNGMANWISSRLIKNFQ